MIGTIDVKVQAHNPNFPLEPVFTFINSAQSFRIRNVPRAIGKWNITKVFIHLNYPDNTTVQKECVLNGNIWIGTVEGCATSGTSTNGFYVTASGIDENENVITNYVLGAGDLYVKDLDGTIDPERVGTKMYFNDTIPTNPKKGDATFIDGVLNVYDGTNWTPVADDPDLSNYYTKTEVDEALGEVEDSIPTKTSDLTNDSGFITSSAIPSNVSSFNNDAGYITASAIPSNVSAFNNDAGYITLAQVPTPSYIQDADGRKIEADLDCITQDLTLPWTLADGADTYTLNYAEQSGKWLYEEAETKKIELAYTAENSLWELSFYVWNNGEWQYDTGSTTTQEEDATSLSILEWILTRSILASRKLATQTGGVEKLVEDANDEHSTRVVVDEYDNVLVQKYTTGWYVSKIEVSIGTTTDFTETNEYYAYLTDVRLDTEEGRLYYTTVAQDKQRNLNLYKFSGSTTNYSTGEFIITIGWTATQTGGQAIYLHLTVTNAETPVWVNIARLVPDSAKWSGLFDTQITPKGQFLTPTQVKPYNGMLGYASRAQGSLFMFGRTGALTPDENHFVTIDYNVGKLCYVGQEQYPWELSMYNGTTFDPPIQMTYGYRATVGYRYNGRIRNISINSNCWLGTITVDSRNTRPCYIKGIEDEYGSIVPDNNFYYYGAAYPITFSTNKLSIETIDGVEGGITCTRQRTGTHQTELKYVAYEDFVPTKTSDLTNDSGFITSSALDVKRDLSDMKVKGVPQNTNSQSWFSIKYGTTTENAWYYDEGRWETGETLRVLTAQATIYTLQKLQDGQWTNIGEFTLDNNAEATITYEGVTYSITGYVGEIVTSNQLTSQIAALEARIAALENNNQ